MVLPVEVVGLIGVMAYFYVDDGSRHGFLVDPGAEAGRLLRIAEERQLVVEKILLTHGHFDHIMAVEEIRKKLGIPVCMHANGRDYAESTEWNLSESYGRPLVLRDVTYLEDGADIALAANPAFSLRLVHVPGHTTDGAMYYSRRDGLAFVGDSIFEGSYGRTDFYGGDEETLFRSIRERILSLPDGTVLLSGHSGPTTVQEEKSRPWFR